MAEAAIDWLTGIASRRRFEEEAQTLEAPSVLLMLDVDRFAWYNHDFWHVAGDNALCSLAGILLRHARPTDLVVRYGGDEFVALLPQTTLSEAELIAERVCADVAVFSWPNRPLTVSIGVAALEAEPKTWQDTIVAADEALHEAKLAGGNCVRSAR